ncbi:helix-turn-helix domain-containing protein [Mucilaginibacter conchicola]|nr:helix-turn-helix transcriptional regulator [Mucilaginibacter conchicola]
MAKPERKGQENEALAAVQKQLGARIREVRKQKGFSSSEAFALAVNINRTQYNNYEIGKANIQFATLIRIFEGLEISPKEFFAEGFEKVIRTGF